MRHLTLTGNAGDVTVPPGAYGALSASGNSAVVLGIAGSSEPAAYDVESLKLDGCALKILGPVRLRVAQFVSASGGATTVLGHPEHPEWLTLELPAGLVTLSGHASGFGSIAAPLSEVSLAGNASLQGSVIAGRLTIGGNAVVRP